MYAIKIIQTDKDGRQLIELLSGKEIKYEFGTYKKADEFEVLIIKFLGDLPCYEYHGHTEVIKTEEEIKLWKSKDGKLKGPKQFILLRIFNGNEWESHVIEDSWVFIMLNGKTIDKLTVI